MGSLRGVTRRLLAILVLFSLFAMNLTALAQDGTNLESTPPVPENVLNPPSTEEDVGDPPITDQQDIVDPSSLQQGPVVEEGDGDLPPVTGNQDNQLPPADELPSTTVVLVEPSVQPDSCVDGVYTAATVGMSDDGVNPAVTYQVTGPDATGNWSVLATLQPGYSWGDLSGTSWQILDATQATASGIVTITPCAPPPVVPDEQVPPQKDEETVASPTAPVTDPESTPAVDESTPDASTQDAPVSMRSLASISILAASCDGPPYAAPTGVQVASPLTGVTITINGVTYTDGAVIPFPDVNANIQVNYTWGLVGSVNGGDYFQFALPAELMAPTLFFPVTTPDGSAEVACASVNAGVVTVVFTDYVNGRDALDGAFSFGTELSEDQFTEETQVPIVFDGLATFTLVIPPPIPPDTGLNQAFFKDGWFTRADQGVLNPDNAILWTAHLPARGGGNSFHNVVVEDDGSGQSAWVVECDVAPTFETSPAGAVINPTVECDEATNFIRITIPVIPTRTNVIIRWHADIVLNSPGPYDNTVTFSADEREPRSRSVQLVRQVGEGEAEGTFWVVPVAPETGNGVCVGGTFTPPFVTLATTEGITYTMTPETVPLIGGKVTVVASLIGPDYRWDTVNPASGWVYDEETDTYSITLDLLSQLCVDVTPINPAVAQITCVNGTPTVIEPTTAGALFTISRMALQTKPTELVIPVPTEGITYTVEGIQAFGETVVVRAVLDDGYQWPAVLPEDWVKVDPATATLTIILDNPTCETPTVTPTTPPTTTPPASSTPPSLTVTGLPVTGAGPQENGHGDALVIAALASALLAGAVGLYRGRLTER